MAYELSALKKRGCIHLKMIIYVYNQGTCNRVPYFIKGIDKSVSAWKNEGAHTGEGLYVYVYM